MSESYYKEEYIVALIGDRFIKETSMPFSTYEEALEYVNDMLKYHKDARFQINKYYIKK